MGGFICLKCMKGYMLASDYTCFAIPIEHCTEYQTKNNFAPTIECIAINFNVSAEDVVIAMDSAKMPISIFDKFEDDEDGQELIDKIACVDSEESTIDKIHLSNIIDGLNERERKLIILRYFRDKTQSEIAKSLGVSQVQVSRLESKVMKKIRNKYL